MKILVINLKRRQDRLEKILSGFAKYNFSNYEVIEAIDAKEFAELPKQYKSDKAKRFNKELSNSEIACAMSHQKCYDRIIQLNETAIIIEDDCPITKELIDFANGNEHPVNDILLLGYYTSNETGAFPQQHTYEILDDSSGCRMYFKNIKKSFNGVDFYKFDERTYKVDFLHGAHCYCVTPYGARILQCNKNIMVEADNIWCLFDLKIDLYGARPMSVGITGDRSDSDIGGNERRGDDEHQFFKNHEKRFTDPRWAR
jgi:GR25 family glycosyltransferase involved in LPS biosynthesis